MLCVGSVDSRPSNLERWMLAAEARPGRMLAMLATLLAAQIGPWWYASDDSHSYLSIARSIAEGVGPTNLGSSHLWFSPGYPVLICPTFLLADRPFLAISVCQWLLVVGFMLGVYRWSRGVVGDASIWIASLAVINHAVWVHYRRPLSEMAFMCLLVWTAIGWRAALAAKSAARSTAWLWLANFLAAALCLVRPVGIVLCPGCIVAGCLAARRGTVSWRRAAMCAVAISAAATVPVAMVAAHERATAGSHDRTYLDEFREAADDLLPNYAQGLQICVSDIGRLCIPGMFKTHGTPGDWADINMLLHVPFVVLLGLGWWRWVRRQDELLAWCLPFFVALLVAHAIATGARLMLPILPALLVCFWLAIERLRPTSRRRLVAVVLISQLLVATSYWLFVDAPRALRNHQRWAAVDALTSTITGDPGRVAI
ncbi:MAG TPA: hypothetical protein VFW87_05670, partial [Pirellulales bacterium]|nr:hypothetical protein [Pirellulales bacterium]